MARPKFPKKNDLKEALPTISAPPPVSISTEATAETASSAIPETEVRRTEEKPRKSSPRKPEIVKTEPRANLIPMNLEDEIRQLAYLLSERRGFVPGHEAEDWLAAELDVRQRYQQQRRA